MDLTRIKKLSENFDGGLRRVAELAGMSEQNIHRCVRNNRIQATDLSNVSKVLGVPVSYFFEDEMAETATRGGNANVNQSGGNSFQSNGGDITVNEAAEGMGRSKLAELRQRNLSLSRELESAKKLLASLESQIEFLRSSLADKDRIIELLSR